MFKSSCDKFLTFAHSDIDDQVGDAGGQSGEGG